MLVVGDLGRHHDDGNVDRAEFMIDHGTVADITGEAQITLDERRQAGQRAPLVDLARAASCSCRHSGRPARLRAELRRRQMPMMEIGERHAMRFGIGAGKLAQPNITSTLWKRM